MVVDAAMSFEQLFQYHYIYFMSGFNIKTDHGILIIVLHNTATEYIIGNVNIVLIGTTYC